jgi:hypothetical protein
MPKLKCNHNWQPLKRGSSRERCTKCKDVYPCRGNNCAHVDCIVDTGRTLPEHITLVKAP